MFLYSTVLLIDYYVIPYEVYKEGDRLFFKPLKMVEGINLAIFWVKKIDNLWKPMNIGDEIFLYHVHDDILKHEVY